MTNDDKIGENKTSTNILNKDLRRFVIAVFGVYTKHLVEAAGEFCIADHLTPRWLAGNGAPGLGPGSS